MNGNNRNLDKVTQNPLNWRVENSQIFDSYADVSTYKISRHDLLSPNALTLNANLTKKTPYLVSPCGPLIAQYNLLTLTRDL